MRFYLVFLKPLFRSNFEEFVPNFQRMLDSGQGDLEVRGVIVTVKGSQEFGYCNNKQTAYDFVSRYFAPWVGVNEDPVTGRLWSFMEIFVRFICFDNQASLWWYAKI